MRRVLKYPVCKPGDHITLDLPLGARVVHFAEQRGVLMMWVDEPEIRDVTTRRQFGVITTGWSYPPNSKVLFSTLCHNGAEVWHLIERVAP